MKRQEGILNTYYQLKETSLIKSCYIMYDANCMMFLQKQTVKRVKTINSFQRLGLGRQKAQNIFRAMKPLYDITMKDACHYVSVKTCRITESTS